MSGGDGWQGEVLRDLGAGPQQDMQGAGGYPYPRQEQQAGQQVGQWHQAGYQQQHQPQHHGHGQGQHHGQGQGQHHGQGQGQHHGQGQGQYQRQEQPAPVAYGLNSPSHAAPHAQPVVDEGLGGAVLRKPQHGEPFVARAVRAVRRSLSSSAAREVAEVTHTAAVLQQPVTTGRQIAVTSIRGGSGKSTVAALLGTAYAHYRQDPVLFLEADPALGSLPLRLGAQMRRWTTSEIADIVKPDMSLLDVTGYLVQLPNNAWLLPASKGEIGVMLDSRAYERAVVALRRYFGVMVVDCETLPAEVARVALAASHGRVLTAPATPEGVTSTYSVLQWMQRLPRQVIANTVVVLTELVPHQGLDLDQVARQLKTAGVSVQVLPYDRHLAAGGPVRTEFLAASTREAAARIAAEVFQLSQKRH